MKSLKDVMSAEINIKVDKALFKDFRKFVMGIYTRDDEHVKFLSGNLIGINTPYFFDTDTRYFWDSIMDVDKIELSRRYHYPETIVRKEWNVAGDLMSNAMVWLMHLVLVSELSDDDKEAFFKEILILFQYRFLTSKIFRDYGLGAKQSTATAAYDALGGHFLIKQCDSWMEYFKMRAQRMWDGDGSSKHKDMRGILRSYSDDVAVTYVIAGISNNMNDMIKAYNKIFHALHDAGKGISLSSPVEIDKDGGSSVSDNLGGFHKYLRTINSRIGIRDEFYNEELLDVIMGCKACRPKKVRGLMDYISDNYGVKKEVEEFVTNGAIFSFSELFGENVVIGDVRTVVKILFGKFSARRMDNAEYDMFEKAGGKVLRKSVGDKKHGITARNVVMVYIIVWAILSNKEV